MPYNNSLFPPIETSWFRLDSHVLLDNRRFSKASISWKVDAYVYTVNAKPDRDFKKNGGLVFIVLAHRGFCFQWTDDLKFYVKFPTDKVELVKHFPSQESYTKDDTRRTYPISFKQTMQMFQSNGNEPVSFTASFEDEFPLNKFEYLAAEDYGDGSHGWQIKSGTSSDTRYPFSALSVYRLSSLEAVPFTFQLRNAGESFDREVKINAVFNA